MFCRLLAFVFIRTVSPPPPHPSFALVVLVEGELFLVAFLSDGYIVRTGFCSFIFFDVFPRLIGLKSDVRFKGT